eukprot:TRINITY_DN453_c2_g1_i1.p1 TRINITY_DN453_c2_g1~~TRINITY_DN453_c2_g1_i1.p1  ORF type:complete len:652 (+),score=175.78 TRINITY_DN453_c2_g1_i1:86-1957(+)
MGKKASAAIKKKTGVTIPPTKHRVIDEKKQGHLRSNRVVGLEKMRKEKVKRDKKTGALIKGSVLDHTDKTFEKGTMARIAPDRKWFGAPRVIGQDAMQNFKDEMAKKMADPYTFIVKPSELPLSLLEEPKIKENLLEKKQMDFKGTFGKGSRRKRCFNMSTSTLDEYKGKVEAADEKYDDLKDRQLLSNIERESDPLTSTAVIGRDKTIDRAPFDKGQSGRIWNQLWKVIDSSDIILQVLDARDPMGTRSEYLEKYLQKEKKFKHVIFVLNKVDLVPTWVTARWLQILSKERPTVAFHGSLTNPFGKGNLINLLRQFSRLHSNVKGKKGGKKTISVGLIGYPNVGKSSVINTIKAKKVCNVAPIPGETKVWQYINLSKSIFLIDCPGVIHDSDHKNNDVEAVLKGVVRVERMGDSKDDVVRTILDIIKKEDLIKTYEIQDFDDSDDFLTQIAVKRGKLLRGGFPDTDATARMVLHDWVRGRLPWFNAPPFDSNQQFRDSQQEDESLLLKKIQNYSTFNIINEQLKSKIQQEEEGLDVSDDEGEQQQITRGHESDSEQDDEEEEEEEEEEEDLEEAKPSVKRPKVDSKPDATAASLSWDALRKASAGKTTPNAGQKVRLVRKKK